MFRAAVQQFRQLDPIERLRIGSAGVSSVMGASIAASGHHVDIQERSFFAVSASTFSGWAGYIFPVVTPLAMTIAYGFHLTK